jgi:hypothetical protein
LNWSKAPVAEVPLGVVTVTSTVPEPDGDVAVTCVSETTLKLAAVVVPKDTLVAPVNPDPVIVTEVPPAVGPEDGEIEVTVCALATTTPGTTTRPMMSAKATLP